ncbi:lipopolysaccharide assembly protein LapB [Chroococcus sp. FPU101]|uniref:tetratricopeptide repeat protein n=1 Tax=Chroococcus sp. FPU101 TaxID=1974212 RepID=UPI001A905FAE|nr:tetratricopeptide repeat protein [Chroococcus sp. FPU101]GFE68534.1 Tetratricopeptide domain protein [Chroococcus sp. FPU101]
MKSFFILALTTLLIEGTIYQASAQNQPSPIEQPVTHPILPKINRPLSPLERRILRESLDQMNVEAQAQLNAGNEPEAFNIWYKELALRRYLGPNEEIPALGRVGAIAWNKDRTDDVRSFTERINTLQLDTETKGQLTPETLPIYAQAYQELHSLDDSLDIYQKMLANARQSGDQVVVEELLNKIGELHLSRFDYPNAAPVYEELLDIVQARSDSLKEGVYLQKLAEIYREMLQPGNSLKYKEELVENYLKNQRVQELPNLKISIGEDYEALKQPERASQSYQEAYSLAWSLLQFGTAGEALNKLAKLYENSQQYDLALQIYQELIKVQQRGYDYYGLMGTYDQMGEIYLIQKNLPLALDSFQKGLELARAISYKEEYFSNKIAQVNQQINLPK